MQCKDIQDRLFQGEMPEGESPDFKNHLATCDACRAVAQRNENLDQILNLDSDAPPRPGFDTAFFARLQEEKVSSSAPRWLRRGLGWPGWLLAGGAIAAAAIGWLLLTPASIDPSLARDLPVALELDMLEDLEVLQRLDELEAYEVLAQVDLAELEQFSEVGQ